MAALSGQTTVATAGTAVPLAATSTIIGGPIVIKALFGNTGMMYVGNDGAGDVTSANGFELDSGDTLVLSYVYDLRTIYVDSSVNGEKVCWHTQGVM